MATLKKRNEKVFLVSGDSKRLDENGARALVDNGSADTVMVLVCDDSSGD
jgi:hypothetical protein